MTEEQETLLFEQANERRAVMQGLLDLVAIARRPCRWCGAEIVLLRLPQGRCVARCYPSGRDHAAECPRVEQVRRESAPRPASEGGLIQLPPTPPPVPEAPPQAQLFDTWRRP